MKKKAVRFGKGFKVLIGNRRAQAVQMVIAPGDAEGGPGNRHRNSDQWLFVIAGKGIATIRGRRDDLKRNSLLLIEHGEQYQIRTPAPLTLRLSTSTRLPDIPSLAVNYPPANEATWSNRVSHGS
jgi:mannose-6-phosphate isomerase-like protein (cupin superfamily)